MMRANRMGYYTVRMLHDGRILFLIPLTLGRARIILARGWMWDWMYGSW